MFKFNEYYLIKENFNQLKSLVKSHGTSKDVIDNGYGTPTGVEKGSDDYELLYTLISPDEKHKEETKNDMYGDMPVNSEKERTMRPFLGMMAKMYYEEKCDLSIIRMLTNWILANKQTLNRLVIKDNNTHETHNLTNLLDIFKFKSKFNDGRPAYEILTDAIRDKGGSDKVREWINRMPSILKNSFKDEAYYKELSNLLNVFDKLSNDNQKSITTALFGGGERKGKISRFKHAEDFLKAFKIDIKNYQKEYNIDIIKEQVLNTKGAKLVLADYENNYLIADIMNYSASNSLGEINNWCISYSASHWYDTYMNYEERNKMFFLWNFNLDSSNQYSKLGLCVKPDGTERAFHDKLDNSIDEEVLDEYHINKDFMKIKTTEEEYEFQKREYLKYSVLKKPFKRYTRDIEEAKPICDKIVDLYNSGDIEDERMIELWDNIYELQNFEVLEFVIKYILDNTHLKPIRKPNKILNDYLLTVYNDDNIEKINSDIVSKLFDLYNIEVYYLDKPVLEYLKKNFHNIYLIYFKKVKENIKKYDDDNAFSSNKTILENLDEEFISSDYNLLVDYTIHTDNVSNFIIEIFRRNQNYVNDLIAKNYEFKGLDIFEFLQHFDFDISKIKISEDELNNLLKRLASNHPKLENFENLDSLFKANNKTLYNAENDLPMLEFFVENNIDLDKIKWHLNISNDDKRGYGSSSEKRFLEKNESINIYQEFKKGNISIEDNSFYYKHIIEYVFKNDLPIEESEKFLQSYLNESYRLEQTPLNKIKPVINLLLKYNHKIPAEIAKISLQNNLYDTNKLIDNLDFTEDYNYGNGSEEIIKELLSYDSPYADTIISKLPNLAEYDMDEVGNYIKNVRIINKFLDICKKPKDNLLYSTLKYGYEKDNKEGDIGDNEETIKLIDRLVNMGHKFDFKDDRYWSLYFIFEDFSLFMLKTIIDKKYFNILKLDREKICKGVLKQNDIELFNYFKSILPKRSFKLEHLSSNPKKEIVENILTWDSENFMDIFSEIENTEDYIYFYDKFYPRMTDENKERIVNNLLSDYRSRELKGKIAVLNHIITYEDNKQYIHWNWDENKRRKNYSDSVRAWIKSFINPPKVKVQKIKEMFNINIPNFIYKKK
jgi:hypothetical protein